MMCYYLSNFLRVSNHLQCCPHKVRISHVLNAYNLKRQQVYTLLKSEPTPLPKTTENYTKNNLCKRDGLCGTTKLTLGIAILV